MIKKSSENGQDFLETYYYDFQDAETTFTWWTWPWATWQRSGRSWTQSTAASIYTTSAQVPYTVQIVLFCPFVLRTISPMQIIDDKLNIYNLKQVLYSLYLILILIWLNRLIIIRKTSSNEQLFNSISILLLHTIILCCRARAHRAGDG